MSAFALGASQRDLGALLAIDWEKIELNFLTSEQSLTNPVSSNLTVRFALAKVPTTMNLLLLGAGGFIGSNLTEHLLRCGHVVTGVDQTGEKLNEVVHTVSDDARRRLTFHETDIRTSVSLVRELVQRSDVVVDLIAHANPSLYNTRPLDVFELNFLQNLEIARLCIVEKKWLIQYSSAEMYGKTTGGASYSEDFTDSVFGPVQKQRWIYAVGKNLLERVLYAHGEAGDLTYTIVRPFNYLGPRLDYLVPAGATGGPRVFPHFMSALLTGGPLRLVDGGHARRAFLHIADGNAAFTTLLANRQRAYNQIYNVGNPDNQLTIRELALVMQRLYEQLTGEKSRSAIEVTSGEEFYGPGYEDSDRDPPDITKMRALGWEPRHGLGETLRETMTYYLRREGRQVV